MNLSFAGCGFLGIYHIGAASAIKEYAPELLSNKMCGVSAGSLAATSVVCNFGLGQATSDWLKMGIRLRATPMGALSPSLCLATLLERIFRENLPPDGYKRATDRLYISLTRLSDGKNVLVHTYDCNQDLVDALICSCFIPFYCGTVPPTFKGVRYIDGGFSDNQPVLDANTITVSPFSGESDICPADADSASFFGMDLSGMSVRFTSSNLYRLSVALFPPHPEVMARMCRQGFEDALRFLARHDMISCTRCIEVRSCITMPEADALPNTNGLVEDDDDYGGYVEDYFMVEQTPPPSPLVLSRVESMAELVSASELQKHPEHRHVAGRECETCKANLESAVTKGLPHAVQHPLESAAAFEKSLVNWIWSSRAVRVVRYLSIPWLLPWQLGYAAFVKVLEWLPTVPSDARWMTDHASTAAQFLVQQIQAQRHRYSARFTCQLAITELNITPEQDLSVRHRAHTGSSVDSTEQRLVLPPTAVESSGPSSLGVGAGAPSTLGAATNAASNWEETEMKFGFSVDLNTRSKPVRHLAAMVNQTTPQSSNISAHAFAQAAEDLEWESLRATVAAAALGRRSGRETPSSCGTPADHPPTTSALDDGHKEDEMDTVASVLEYTRHHESLMAFYYMDENNQVQVTEIFGIEEPLQEMSLRHMATGSVNSRPPSRDTSRHPSFVRRRDDTTGYRDRATSGASVVSFDVPPSTSGGPQEAVDSAPTDEQQDQETTMAKEEEEEEEEMEVEEPKPEPSVRPRKLSGVDSGFSMGEESNSGVRRRTAAEHQQPARRQASSRRDACCSPVKELESAPTTSGAADGPAVSAGRQSSTSSARRQHHRLAAPWSSSSRVLTEKLVALRRQAASSDSEGEHGEKFFVPTNRRERTLSVDYEAEDSSTEEN